ELGAEERTIGVPGCTTKPLTRVAISPPVLAVSEVAPTEASGGMARFMVAVVGLVTCAPLTAMPSPKVKIVLLSQWVFWPTSATGKAVAPCRPALGVTDTRVAKLGVTSKKPP